VPAVTSARLLVLLQSKMGCNSLTTVGHVTEVIFVNAVARMLFCRPLRNPSAQHVSPLVIPGVLAQDVKAMAVIMTIAVQNQNKTQQGSQGTANVVLYIGSVLPATRSSQILL